MARRGKPAAMRIGEMAVARGYCTAEQVNQALRLQRELAARGREPRPLLGILMVQRGILSTGQLIALLKALRDAEGQ